MNKKFKLVSIFFIASLSLQIQSTVHVFGDSHAFFCFSNNQIAGPADELSNYRFLQDGQEKYMEFNIHYLGPVTMHRVGRDGFDILTIKRDVRKGDTVVFVFGEIDVRCHIGKQRDERKRLLSEIIHTLVNKYIATIFATVKQHALLKVVIMSPTPPSDMDPASISLPVYGFLQDRVNINNALCNELESACNEYGYYFLDIRPYFCSLDGSLAFELSDGNVHVGLTYNHVIKEKLLKLIERK